MKSKVLQKLFSLFLSLLLVFSMAPVLYASQLPNLNDISGNWASAEITKWVSNGIIKGLSNGEFKPNNSISRAEFISLVSRILNLTEKSKATFKDVSTGAWYADDISKASNAGFIKGDPNGNVRPEASISRQEAAVVFAKAFDLKAKNKDAYKSLSDAGKIAEWSKDSISAMVENGYIKGRLNGEYAPVENITRAESVKLIDNIVGELKNTVGTYNGTISGNLVVNTRDIVLKDMIISGNLYLTQGIGDGNVTLDGVTVKGSTIVKGGGEHSVILRNTNLTGSLIVIRENGRVRIVTEGTTIIGNVEVSSIAPGQEIILDGDFTNVDVESQGAQITVNNGSKINSLTIGQAAAGTSVQLDQGTAVTTLTAAAGATVTGQGTITNAAINAVGVTIQEKPTNVTVAPGITATINGQATTGGSSSGGGGSSSGGGSSTTQTVAATGISATTSGGALSGSVSGTTATLNFTSTPMADSITISAVEITGAPAGSTLAVSSVNSTKLGNVSLSRTINSITNIPISSLLVGSSNNNVSLGTLRTLFENTITISGTLSCSGFNSSSVSLVLTLGPSVGNGNVPNEWVTVETNGTTLTATIKSTNKGLTKLSDIGIATFLTATIGQLPSEVRIGGAGLFKSNYTDIKSDIIAATGANSWTDITLNDLVGKTIEFKRSGDTATIYTVVVVAAH